MQLGELVLGVLKAQDKLVRRECHSCREGNILSWVSMWHEPRKLSKAEAEKVKEGGKEESLKPLKAS